MFQVKNAQTGAWQDATPAKADQAKSFGLEVREVADVKMSSFDSEVEAQFRVAVQDQHADKDDLDRIKVAYVTHADLGRTLADILGVSESSKAQATPNPEVAEIKAWVAAQNANLPEDQQIKLPARGALPNAVKLAFREYKESLNA